MKRELGHHVPRGGRQNESKISSDGDEVGCRATVKVCLKYGFIQSLFYAVIVCGCNGGYMHGMYKN